MPSLVARKLASVSTPAEFHELVDYITRGANVRALRMSPNLLTVETAAGQMATIASCNSAVKNYGQHLMISLAKPLVVSNDQLFAIAEGALEALNLKNRHQWIMAIHDDTDYQHVHIVFNVVDPNTKLAVQLKHDFLKVNTYLRTVERQYGWDSTIEAARIEGHAPYSIRARDQEAHTLQSSFQRWIFESVSPNMRKVCAQDGATWAEFHESLSTFGLRYSPFGKGAGIADIAGSERACGRREGKRLTAKASHLGLDLTLKRLVEKFGPYEPLRGFTTVQMERTYGYRLERGGLVLPLARHPSVEPFFRQYTLERDQRSSHKEREMPDAIVCINQELKKLQADQARLESETLAEVLRPSVVARSVIKKIAYNLIELARRKTRQVSAELRQALREKYKKLPTFRAWLKSRARKDPGAQIALRILRAATGAKLERVPIKQDALQQSSPSLMLTPPTAAKERAPLAQESDVPTIAIQNRDTQPARETRHALVDLARDAKSIAEHFADTVRRCYAAAAGGVSASAGLESIKEAERREALALEKLKMRLAEVAMAEARLRDTLKAQAYQRYVSELQELLKHLSAQHEESPKVAPMSKTNAAPSLSSEPILAAQTLNVPIEDSSGLDEQAYDEDKDARTDDVVIDKISADKAALAHAIKGGFNIKQIASPRIGKLHGSFLSAWTVGSWGYGIFHSPAFGLRLLEMSPERVETALELVGRRMTIINNKDSVATLDFEFSNAERLIPTQRVRD